MRVLVSGATGFIGSRLCSLLAAAGHSAAALSRDPSSARARVPVLSAAFPWEPRSGAPPAEAFEGVDAVVHLAGESLKGRWTPAKKRAIRDSRILGTRNLVQGMAALKDRPRSLVSASAVGYYGDRGDEMLTEDSAPGKGFLAEVCVEWEREALAVRSLEVRVACLRTGVVLGRAGGAIPAMLLPFKLGLGGPLGSGRQWWSWVHVDDEAGFILHALAQALDGPFNIAAPNPARQRDLARSMGRSLGRPAFLPAPSFALDLALGEVATELLYSRRALPKRAQEAGYAFKFPHLDAALKDILG